MMGTMQWADRCEDLGQRGVLMHFKQREVRNYVDGWKPGGRGEVK